MDIGEVAVGCSFFAPGFHENAVLRELGDAGVIAFAVRYENVALSVPCDICGTVKKVGRLTGARRTSSASAAPTTGSASAAATSIRGDIHVLGLAPEQHRDVARLVEFHDGVRHFVDRPDVVQDQPEAAKPP